MVFIFNDAGDCYDFMLHNLMIIATRRMGCPKEATLCHTKVLNHMKHFIKTANDIAEASPAIPLSGCGQGNGCGPISWHVYMGPLIKAYVKYNKAFSL